VEKRYLPYGEWTRIVDLEAAIHDELISQLELGCLPSEDEQQLHLGGPKDQ
jgi:hypothetical protein